MADRVYTTVPDILAESPLAGFNPYSSWEARGEERSSWPTTMGTLRYGPLDMAEANRWIQGWNASPYGSQLSGQQVIDVVRGLSDNPTFESNNAAIQSIIGTVREGWDIWRLSDLDKSNPELANQQWETRPLGNSTEYAYVRFIDQPGKEDVGLGEGSGTGEGEGGGSSEVDWAAMVDAMMGASERALAINDERIGPFLQGVFEESRGVASGIDTAYQRALRAQGITADDIMPGMMQALGISREYMNAVLPQDPQDQIMRYRAELGIARGTGDNMIQYATARDLGLNSLQLQQYGMQMYPQLAGQAISMGQSFIPGTMNLSNIFMGTQQNLAPYSFINPNMFGQSVASAFSQNAQAGSAWDIAQLQADTNMRLSLLEQTYGNYWSSAQQSWNTWQTQLQLAAYDKANAAASRTSRRQGWMNLGAGILGAISPVLGGLLAARNTYMNNSSGGYQNTNPYRANYYS